MHEILRLLGLCFRAGKLVSGDDAVADTVFAGEARLLLLAADARSKYYAACPSVTPNKKTYRSFV